MTEEIKHELWRVVASGGLNLLLSEMQSITSIDTRARLLDTPRDFLRWLRVELAAPGSLAFAVSESSLGLLWDEVQGSAYYAPVQKPQDVPMVTGAMVTGGNTLVADAAPGEYTICVYEFDGLTFAETGTLAEHSQPGAGDYVLVTVTVVEGNVVEASLPSGFLTLTS